VYGVLSKRHAKIISDEMREGTENFQVSTEI
jgi:translation elongation factor EF-G